MVSTRTPETAEAEQGEGRLETYYHNERKWKPIMKITEIKQALEMSTPGKWKGKHAITPYISVSSGVVDEVIATVVMRNNLQLLSNAPEWLRYLIKENEQLQSMLAVAEARINKYVKEETKC